MKVIIRRIAREDDRPKIEGGHVFYLEDEYDGVEDIHITQENVSIIQEYGDIAGDNKKKETVLDPNKLFILSIKIEADSHSYMRLKYNNERAIK